MKRRDFLKTGAAAGALVMGGTSTAHAANSFQPQPGRWRTFETVTRIEIQEPAGVTRVWVPVPTLATADWSKPLDVQFFHGAGGAAGIRAVGSHGVKMVAFEQKPGDRPVLEVVTRYAARDRAVDLTKPAAHRVLSAAERRLYLAPTRFIPTDGIVKATATKIVGNSTDDLVKARKIYEWIVANTYRNPTTRGCGLGDISFMLQTGDLGGKCADLNALMVGLARASGIPARDVYGIRVAPSQFGYRALGANSATITGSQHCRAEVYLTRFGWVPVDPADVRKVMLEEPPGNLPISDAKVDAAYQTLFGAWEGNWMAYNDGHDIALPGSSQPPVPFLMYPQAQTASGDIDCLNPDAFKYAITAKELSV